MVNILSIKRWKSNFIPEKEKVTYSVVWVRLPQLPTEFYDSQLFKKIGNAIENYWKLMLAQAPLSGVIMPDCVFKFP